MITGLPGSIANNVQYFTGRAWLLPKILAWLEQSDERIYLLTGGPGTGKSMIMAWLSGYGPMPADPEADEQLTRFRRVVKASHFCIAESGNTAPRAMAQNIAQQLRNLPPFDEALKTVLAEERQITIIQQVGTVQTGAEVTGIKAGTLNLSGFNDEFSFNLVLRRPLQKLAEQNYQEPIVLLVDALDEALTYSGGPTIVHLLAKDTDLPRNVRFLASTRDDPRVMKYFRDAPVCDLVKDSSLEEDDICQYLSQRLSVEANSISPELRSRVAARLSQKAGGVFLYAVMVLNDLLLRLPGIPDLENYPLPEGLSGLYHEFLNRELGQDEQLWYQIFRPLLGLIAVSRAPGLTRTQLHAISGKDVDQPLRTIKQYLVGDLPEGPFQIFHRSFTEFLLVDDDNLDYPIVAQEMHRLITDYYLQNCSSNWLQCDSYGLNHIVEHAFASRLNDQERKDVFDRILTDDFVNAIQARTGWLFAFIGDLEALALAEPDWSAKLCFPLILNRPPNSTVIQHGIRLLVKLRAKTGPVGNPIVPQEKGLDQVVGILSAQTGDIPDQLMEMLAHETNGRMRGVIALALAETGSPNVAPCLLQMFKNEFGEASWAAADALIALNQQTIIPELIQWYQQLIINDPRSKARKNRILYVLGWMHAESARSLETLARNASDPKIIGRAVDLTWLLQPNEQDKIYLHGQLQRILATSPEQPDELGPWADEWLQKRLVRAIQKLHMADVLPDLRSLQKHIQRRPAPRESADRLEMEAAKRERLLEAVEEAITELQVGR